MIARILLSVAVVAASVGLVIYGMGSSYSPKDDDIMRIGLILMVGGVIGTIIGAVWYRSIEASAEADTQAR